MHLCRGTARSYLIADGTTHASQRAAVQSQDREQVCRHEPVCDRIFSLQLRRMKRLIRVIVRAFAILLALVLIAAIVAVGSAAYRERGDRRARAPASGRFVHSHDVDLFIQEAGPASGPIVVLMHGTGAWSEIWRETMTRLAARGFHAIAIDMPPFGFSERPASNDYTTATQGRRLAALLTQLNASGLTLVGHSFGARAAIEGAMLVPERMRALVLVDAALGLHDADGSPLPESVPPPGLTSKLLAIGVLRRPLIAGLVTNPLMTRTLLQQLISRKEAATPAVIEMLQRPLAVAGGTSASGAWLQWFVNPDRPALSGRLASYRTWRLPTVVIWGSTDTVTPLSQGKALASLIPGAELHVLDGVGHIPAIEAPDAFNELLLTSLER
jgi:pimeloyl-ACP methyl ester carboxylesterase